uniref:PTB domain-containing engulfment adapter protein 1-like n=2 Tax=Astyanax mexicanus TaxID=7994 RepID=A0A3B1J310_ASTMX
MGCKCCIRQQCNKEAQDCGQSLTSDFNPERETLRFRTLIPRDLHPKTVKMSDIEDDTEISFSVKFLDRVEVLRSDGMQILTEATAAVQNPDREISEKAKKKKTKVHLFLSRSAIDILEHKTKFMLYTCPLSSVSFCAVHQTQPKLFGFISRHPALDTYHCYIFQSRKFAHLLVSVIGDAFRASQQNSGLRGSRDLVVEALRHKVRPFSDL